MKLEAIDPLNLSAICVATVMKVLVIIDAKAYTVLPQSIANLAYRQNSRLSRFPLLKIPRYTAKLSYRHPPQKS
jgi:hypothetical protein